MIRGGRYKQLFRWVPHFKNLPLRLINEKIMKAMPVYVPRNESKWKQPADLPSDQAKYETLPTPLDS